MTGVQTCALPISKAIATNFSVLRVKRDVLRRSSVGALFTGRSVGATGTGSNQTYGVDGILALSDTFAVNAYWARTDTTSVSGQNQSYRGQLDYNSDRYGVQLERLSIDDNFNPEIGFVRRDDMRKNFGEFRFSPRPRNIRGVRKVFFTTSLNRVNNSKGRLETRTWDGEFTVDFQNSDRFVLGRNASYEYLPRPFTHQGAQLFQLFEAALLLGDGLVQGVVALGEAQPEHRGHRLRFVEARHRNGRDPELLYRLKREAPVVEPDARSRQVEVQEIGAAGVEHPEPLAPQPLGQTVSREIGRAHV